MGSVEWCSGDGLVACQACTSFGDSVHGCGLDASGHHILSFSFECRLVRVKRRLVLYVFLSRMDESHTSEELPIETLVFSVSDGRVGTITLQGRKAHPHGPRQTMRCLPR